MGLSIVAMAAVLAAARPLRAEEPPANPPAVPETPAIVRPDLPAAPAASATEPSPLVERGPVPITAPTDIIPLNLSPGPPCPRAWSGMLAAA